jgi:hypothetical protein
MNAPPFDLRMSVSSRPQHGIVAEVGDGHDNIPQVLFNGGQIAVQFLDLSETARISAIIGSAWSC